MHAELFNKVMYEMRKVFALQAYVGGHYAHLREQRMNFIMQKVYYVVILVQILN